MTCQEGLKENVSTSIFGVVMHLCLVIHTITSYIFGTKTTGTFSLHLTNVSDSVVFLCSNRKREENVSARIVYVEPPFPHLVKMEEKIEA